MRFLKDIMTRNAEPEDLLPDRDFAHLADTAAEDLMENAADWGEAPQEDVLVLSSVAAKAGQKDPAPEPDADGFVFGGAEHDARTERPMPRRVARAAEARQDRPQDAAEDAAQDMAENTAESDDFVDVANLMASEAPEAATPTGKSDQELAQEALSRLRSPEQTAPDSEAAPQAAAAPQAPGGRVKTRLLGFHADGAGEGNIFAGAAPNRAGREIDFPVGWLVVIDGPGRGASFPLEAGVSQIGRGADQAVSLDFGDTAVSRENHAAVAFDDEQNRFFVGHGGKSNLVRLNDRPVLATEPLSSGDVIRIGETSLRFVAFCSDDFSWSGAGDREAPHARSA